MARLTALPSIDIIRGFKGTLDFYLWKGLPCVRAWPRWRPARQTDASKAAALLFGAIIRGYNLVAGDALTAYHLTATGIPRTPRDIYVSGVFGNLHVRTEPPPPPPPEEEMYDAYICLRDKKPQNTDAGDFVTGAWRTRDLTNKQADPQSICALAANQFILAPGTYRALISCPSRAVGHHQARLYNVTDAAVLLVGGNETNDGATWTGTRALVQGRFTIPAGKTLAVQHRCAVTELGHGLGRACNWTDEIYTVAEFWRETEP